MNTKFFNSNTATFTENINGKLVTKNINEDSYTNEMLSSFARVLNELDNSEELIEPVQKTK